MISPPRMTYLPAWRASDNRNNSESMATLVIQSQRLCHGQWTGDWLPMGTDATGIGTIRNLIHCSRRGLELTNTAEYFSLIHRIKGENEGIIGVLGLDSVR